MGGHAFALPDGIRNLSHPSDDARMRAILDALRSSGFQNDAAEISRRWQEAMGLTTDVPAPDYMHCYPAELIAFVVEKAAKGRRRHGMPACAPRDNRWFT
jgi:hypothetical protein